MWAIALIYFGAGLLVVCLATWLWDKLLIEAGGE